MKYFAIGCLSALLILGTFSTARASGLTEPQINAIIGLLIAFDAEHEVITKVRTALSGISVSVPRETPITPVSQTATTTVPREMPVPTRLEIENSPKWKNHTAGANCDGIGYVVYVYDQYNEPIEGIEVSMHATFSNQTAKTGKNGASFGYTTPARETVETVSFVSGTLSKDVKLDVGWGINKDRLTYNGSRWQAASSGWYVDPVTRLCL